MEAAAFEGGTDDNHTMASSLKWRERWPHEQRHGQKLRSRAHATVDAQTFTSLTLLSRSLWYATRELPGEKKRSIAHKKELGVVRLVVVRCTEYRETWDMALTYHGGHSLSEGEPESRSMLHGGLIKLCDATCEAREPGSQAAGRFVKNHMAWHSRRFGWGHFRMLSVS